MEVQMPAFDSYQITYYSDYDDEALIQLFQGEETVGQIHFVKEGQPLRNMIGTQGHVHITFPISRFDHIMTILLYEKPLYVEITQPSHQREAVGIIGTASKEPVGEQEG
jgi:hypothetical protein